MTNRVIIIAEAGVNHNGSLDMAKKLVDAASDAGADYVKFQSFRANKLASDKALKAEYQKLSSGSGDTQLSMLQSLELSKNDHQVLFNHCEKKGIRFLSSGFDEDSIDLINSFGIDFFKIPSGEITNKPYLIHVAKKGKPVILSTGMATLSEIGDAVEVLISAGLKREQLTVLHCNTEYPTPISDVNLKAMITIKEAFKVRIGYSDHTLGIEVPLAAVALGAEVIEKHFTLDKNLSGPDHKASLEPQELKAMVKAIRNVEAAISGTGIKEPSKSELPNKIVARKSIHLSGSYKKGQIITKSMIEMKRPGDGISPMMIDQVLGRKFANDVNVGHKLDWSDLS